MQSCTKRCKILDLSKRPDQTKYWTQVKWQIGFFLQNFGPRFSEKRKACIICHSMSLIFKIIGKEVSGKRRGGNHKTPFVLGEEGDWGIE